MPPLVLLVCGGIILTIGDIIFKFYTESSRMVLYVLGLIAYLIGAIFLVETYKTENIAIATVVFIIVNVITLLLVSRFYFKEYISAIQLGGICLALVAILCLELGK